MSYHLTEHIDTLHASLNRSMASKLRDEEDTHISKLADNLHKNLNFKEEEEEKKLGGGPAWMIPFLILVVLMIGGAIGLYLFYEKMRKMHLL